MGMHGIVMALRIFSTTTLLMLVKSDTQGFLSIDCGLKGNRYPNPVDTYVSDKGYIENGENKEIDNKYLFNNAQTYQTVRFFNDYKRSCYNLYPVAMGYRYLIRASFMYGNYDGLNKPPSFDLYLGVDLWYKVKLDNATHVLWTETTVYAKNESIYVCLVDNGTGTPFISVLELRPIGDKFYFPSVDRTKSHITHRRVNLGETTEIRSPADYFDRLWTPDQNSYGGQFQSKNDVTSGSSYRLPSVVMKTSERTYGGVITINWSTASLDDNFCVYLHFAGLIVLGGNVTWSLDVTTNVFGSENWFTGMSQRFLHSTTVSGPVTNSTDYVFRIAASPDSDYKDAMLSAYEIYKYYPLSNSTTSDLDVAAIKKIKQLYELKRNWFGDPCLPIMSWDGLACDASLNPATIVALNLSGSNLTGNISDSFALLKSLKTLDLSCNNLISSVPINLQQRVTEGSLKLILDNNGRSCSSTQSATAESTTSNINPHKISAVVVIVPIAVAASIILMLLLFFVVRRRRRAKEHTDPPLPQSPAPFLPHGEFPLVRSDMVFSYADVKHITGNFRSAIGKGGSSTVYYGKLDSGEEIAAKKLTRPTPLAAKEFTNEVNVLMTVHHKHLLSLIGYCEEGDDMILLYEYMPNGNLRELLSDKQELTSDWKLRLDIALAAATGLEYLHNACRPAIIHRDVKSTNILLDSDYVAKVADFGLSKVLRVENINFTTTEVCGTIGYLDPEYMRTNKLTDKSDVYAFGVVLFEILTGKPPVINENGEMTPLIRWAKPKIMSGDLPSWIDPTLQLLEETYLASIWQVAGAAISCIAESSLARPNMTQVVTDLRAAVDIYNGTIQTQASQQEWSLPPTDYTSPMAR